MELDDNVIALEEQADDLCALDDTLRKLAALDPRQVRVVELRFFRRAECGGDSKNHGLF